MCNFSNLKMNDMSFDGSNIIDCDFYGAYLNKASFHGCELKGTLFENCDLRQADFRNATAYTIDPLQNKVKKARFSMPEVLSFLAPYDLEID